MADFGVSEGAAAGAAKTAGESAASGAAAGSAAEGAADAALVGGGAGGGLSAAGAGAGAGLGATATESAIDSGILGGIGGGGQAFTGAGLGELVGGAGAGVPYELIAPTATESFIDAGGLAGGASGNEGLLASLGSYLPSLDQVGKVMSVGQALQQLALQGGATAFQSAGTRDAQQGRQAAVDQFNSSSNDIEARQFDQFNKNVADWSAFNGDQTAYKNALVNQYQETRPSLGRIGANAAESTPDVVKSDLSRRNSENDEFNFARAKAAADMNSVGSLLTAKSDATKAGLQQMHNQDAVSNINQAALTNNLISAALKGQSKTATGNLLSGAGNLLMATQLTKGK